MGDMKKRDKQINLRVDDGFLSDIHEARVILRPSPSAAEIVRIAVREYVDRLRRKEEKAQS